MTSGNIFEKLICFTITLSDLSTHLGTVRLEQAWAHDIGVNCEFLLIDQTIHVFATYLRVSKGKILIFSCKKISKFARKITKKFIIEHFLQNGHNFSKKLQTLIRLILRVLYSQHELSQVPPGAL